MLSISRLSAPRNQLTRELLREKISNVNDTTWLSNFTSRVGISTSTLDMMKNGMNSVQTWAPFAVFKGKAALVVSPSLPTFTKLDSGALRVDRKGAVFLKFMPAIGQRKYDSEKKQIFALSPTEVGSLISLGPAESCEFFHDPSMKSSLEGQVKKTLAVIPLNDSTGYFFNLNVMNSVQKTNERFSVPVSKAEFAVLRTAFSFVLPHMIGWDQVVRPHPLEAVSQPGRLKQLSEVPLDPNAEWGR